MGGLFHPKQNQPALPWVTVLCSHRRAGWESPRGPAPTGAPEDAHEPREELNPLEGNRFQPTRQERTRWKWKGKKHHSGPRRQAKQRKPRPLGSLVADLFRSRITSGQTWGTLPYTLGLAPGTWSPPRLSPPPAKRLDEGYMYAHMCVCTHMHVQI